MIKASWTAQEQELIDAFDAERKNNTLSEEFFSSRAVSVKNAQKLAHHALRALDKPAVWVSYSWLKKHNEALQSHDRKTGCSILLELFDAARDWQPGSVGVDIAEMFSNMPDTLLDASLRIETSENSKKDARKAIHLAIDADHEGFFDWLLKNGSKAYFGNQLSAEGVLPPLIIAAKNGQASMVAKLLAAGANPALRPHDESRETWLSEIALVEAMLGGHWECVKTLAGDAHSHKLGDWRVRDALRKSMAMVNPTQSPASGADRAKVWLFAQAAWLLESGAKRGAEALASSDAKIAEAKKEMGGARLLAEKPRSFTERASDIVRGDRKGELRAKRATELLQEALKEAQAKERLAERQKILARTLIALAQANVSELRNCLDGGDKLGVMRMEFDGAGLGFWAAALAIAALDAPNLGSQIAKKEGERGSGVAFSQAGRRTSAAPLSRSARLAALELMATWPGPKGDGIRRDLAEPAAGADGLSALHFAAIANQVAAVRVIARAAPPRGEDLFQVGAPAALAAFAGAEDAALLLLGLESVAKDTRGWAPLESESAEESAAAGEPEKRAGGKDRDGALRDAILACAQNGPLSLLEAILDKLRAEKRPPASDEVLAQAMEEGLLAAQETVLTRKAAGDKPNGGEWGDWERAIEGGRLGAASRLGRAQSLLAKSARGLLNEKASEGALDEASAPDGTAQAMPLDSQSSAPRARLRL